MTTFGNVVKSHIAVGRSSISLNTIGQQNTYIHMCVEENFRRISRIIDDSCEKSQQHLIYTQAKRLLN